MSWVSVRSNQGMMFSFRKLCKCFWVDPRACSLIIITSDMLALHTQKLANWWICALKINWMFSVFKPCKILNKNVSSSKYLEPTKYMNFVSPHKKWSFPLRISSFTEEIFNGKFHFLCSVFYWLLSISELLALVVY